jgi:putative exporter of polyketide antibiotics
LRRCIVVTFRLLAAAYAFQAFPQVSPRSDRTMSPIGRRRRTSKFVFTNWMRRLIAVNFQKAGETADNSLS